MFCEYLLNICVILNIIIFERIDNYIIPINILYFVIKTYKRNFTEFLSTLIVSTNENAQ